MVGPNSVHTEGNAEEATPFEIRVSRLEFEPPLLNGVTEEPSYA